MKPPKNFYSNLDRRKQGLPEVPEASASDAGKIIKVDENGAYELAEDSGTVLPTPTIADEGKVIKVSDEGAYELGTDENTIIIPNPETTPSATLNTLTIGSTTYKVNDARVTKLLRLRFTINNGGDYNAQLPIVSLVDIYGNAAVLPVYTMTCDKNVQYGGLALDGHPGVLNENLPAKFTVIFNAEFNIEDYPYIKFTKSGTFPQDSAKNMMIEYTLGNDEWVEIADLVSIDWTGDSHVYDMSTGEEVETIPEIPTPTVADAGKFLGVNNSGAWELDNIPNELPTVTSADSGKVLTVDSQGELEFKKSTLYIYGTLDSSSSPTKIVWDNNLTSSAIRTMIANYEDCCIMAHSSQYPTNYYRYYRLGYGDANPQFFSIIQSYGTPIKIPYIQITNSDVTEEYVNVKTLS